MIAIVTRLYQGLHRNGHTFVYMSDILIVWKNMCYVHANSATRLHLEPEKCNFATKQIDYLDHTLTTESVKLKEVCTFLELINFCRKHVCDMATICKLSTTLTQKDRKDFVWVAECEAAFENIKQLLFSASLLHPSYLDKEFFVWMDASEC